MPTSRRPAPTTASRDQLIEALLWESLTVEELADRIGLTPNGVRSQLVGLERDGMVAKRGVRHAGGVGKPPVVYALTRHAEQQFSAAYPAALTAILETLRAGLDPKSLKGLLTKAGARLAGSVPGKDAAGVLESLGAKVRTAPGRAGHETVAGASCPLAAAVSQEPATCELVRSLLTHTLDRPVKMQCHHGDRPRCCFDVGPAKDR